MRTDLENRELTVLFVTLTVLVAVALLQLNALLAILESIYTQQTIVVSLATCMVSLSVDLIVLLVIQVVSPALVKALLNVSLVQVDHISMLLTLPV